MPSNISFKRYYNVDSLVHRLSPLFKIISLFIMIISLFFINSYIDIIILSIYLILSIILTKINIKVYLKNILSIKFFLLFIFIIDILFASGLNILLFDIFKLIFILLYSSILSYTTSITELNYGIELFLSPLKRIIPVSDIAMIISLSIRYIPTLTTMSSRIINAEKVRGIEFDTSSIKDKIKNINTFLLPLFNITLRKSNTTGDIMDLRLYNYGMSKTNYHSNSWRLLDTILLILNIIIILLIIFI